MTDSTAETDAFADISAAHPLVAIGEDRERQIWRTVAGVAAVVVHILALALILFGNQIPVVQRIRETIPEAIMWIPIPKPATIPKKEVKPEPLVTYPILTAPIIFPKERHKELEAPPSEGLLGVGRSLACGASSYENLPAAQREQCYRHPWAFVKRPDGTIVLDVPKTEPPPSAADIIRHEEQTAPPCPMLANVPCLGRVLHGDPLGGTPSPF